jgi:hypothetical protein
LKESGGGILSGTIPEYAYEIEKYMEKVCSLVKDTKTEHT